MSKLTAAEEALARLATLGPERYFRPPNTIVDAAGAGAPSDHPIETGIIGVLEAQDLVYRHPSLNAYGLTTSGVRKAAEVILHKVELAPIDALAVLVQFSAGVSIQKGSGGKIVAQAIHGGTVYMAANENLNEVILELKTQFDRVVLGG